MTGINLLSNKMKNNIIIPILVLLSIIIGGIQLFQILILQHKTMNFLLKTETGKLIQIWI